MICRSEDLRRTGRTFIQHAALIFAAPLEIRRDKRLYSAWVKIGEGFGSRESPSFYEVWPYRAKRFGCQSIKGRVRFEEKPATEHSMASEHEL
jgi:hypothetical protein